MAFDGHQSPFANSLFPSYQRQASVNVSGGNLAGAALPFVSTEQDTPSYVPWSHNAHDDPYDLSSCAQSSIKSRKPSDSTDCDGETDLQGLVSNILDESDSQDNCYSEGNLPTCNPVWSPKTLREELLQYFQSEAKTQSNPTFPPNYVSCEAFNKAEGLLLDKDVEDFCPQPTGLSINHWPFNLPNSDRDSYNLRPQKLPPGLPVPNAGHTYLSQIQQNKYDSTSASKDRGNSQPMNNFSDLSDVFKSEINSQCFHPYYEDHYIQSSAKPTSNEPYVPQDINQLVSSLQSFMASEHDSLFRGDFPNMHRQTAGLHHEDSTLDQWKNTSPTMQTQKQLVGEFGAARMERNGGVRKQTLNCDAFQDPPGFSPQNGGYFQQPKLFSASLNLPNQHQSKMSMQRENTLLPINMSMNQFSQLHIQRGQMQSKINPQMQKEKRMHMPGFLGEGFPTRPPANTNIRVEHKKQAFSQNLNFDNMQPPGYDGENSMVSTGNTQPFMYPINDPRRHSSMPINSNFSPRSTLTYGSGRYMGDVTSANEPAAFKSYVCDVMSGRGESTYHGIASAMTASAVMSQGGPVIQLYFYLDECYEQWRCLEKERKRTEAILTKTFVGKRPASVINTNLPKTPPNPTRVDHLIVNQMREQARVANLLDRMECLYNTTFHINIHTALNKHHMAICIAQARRKEEIANMSKQQRQRAHLTEDRDTLLLVIALKDLAATTRKLRTALWCAQQMTQMKPVKRPDHHLNREVTPTERCPSPFEGYSFKL